MAIDGRGAEGKMSGIMPTYVYRIIKPGEPAEQAQTFEVRQSIHDPPLTKHPRTGEPIERVLMPPTIARGNRAAGGASNSDIAAAGFTKYKKTSDGTYERQAGGGGPKRIDPQKFKK
jgi:predicted nucleic acid-binding Zn ribbon protein